MHIYAFGSVCRGDVQYDSDVDMLAIVDQYEERFSREKFSIYSYRRIKELWLEGSPFAWHLMKESAMVYSSTKSDFIQSLGEPAPYSRCVEDCLKFYELYVNAKKSLSCSMLCCVFDFSSIFLSLRNYSTCFALGVLSQHVFSRDSPLRLGTFSLDIPDSVYWVLSRCRVLSTRGVGDMVTQADYDIVIRAIDSIDKWFVKLNQEVGLHV